MRVICEMIEGQEQQRKRREKEKGNNKTLSKTNSTLKAIIYGNIIQFRGSCFAIAVYRPIFVGSHESPFSKTST